MNKLIFSLLLLSATSSGQTFTKITSFPVHDALCTWVFSTTENNAFVTLFSTKALYSTHNGGASWDSVILGPDVYDLTDVYFADSAHGWVTGNISGSLGHGKLFKTIDGGASWKDVTKAVNGDLGISKFSSVRFNGSNGIIGSSNGFVDADNQPLYYQTTNDGASWTKIHVVPGMVKGDAFEITRISNSPANKTFQLTGIYASFSNLILNSLDNGHSFNRAFSEFAAPGENIPLDIFNINGSNTVYWIADRRPKKSIDGGITFIDFAYPAGLAGTSVFSGFFDTPEEGYIVGDKSSIYKTSDGGVTWTKLHDAMPGYRLRNVFRSGRTIWAVGEEGAVYKTTLAAPPTTIKNFSVKPVLVYPNPASDFIILHEKQAGKIQLFNEVGQEVSQQVQTSVLSGGEIKIAIDGLTSGLYFIKTRTGLYKVNKN